MNAEHLPLHGVRVVSLAMNLPGPLATARLVRMGAAVVKVEHPSGDPLRAIDPDWYEALSAGQEIIALDLKSREGIDDLHELLGSADLLLTATRPAALGRLGLSWRELHQRHPRLSQVAIVGHPPPAENHPGHDLTYQAAAGLLTGRDLPVLPLADLAGAERASTECLVTLVHRGVTGTGCRREVALAEVCFDFAEPLRRRMLTQGGPLGGESAYYRIYDTRHGQVALAAVEHHFRERIDVLLDLGDPAVSLADVFATRTASEWADWAERHDLPLVAVRD